MAPRRFSALIRPTANPLTAPSLRPTAALFATVAALGVAVLAGCATTRDYVAPAYRDAPAPELPDGPVKVDSFKLVDSAPGRALVELQLHEGRKHVVRRLLEAVGHPVITLVRTDVGPIRLGDLRSGRMRALNQPEIGQLYSAAGL